MLSYIKWIVIIISSCAVQSNETLTKTSTASADNPSDIILNAQPEPNGAITDEFVDQLFSVCRVEISEVKRKLLTVQLEAVVNKYFTNNQDKQSFLYLICIESKFQNSARSKVGAVGYTQIMPKYAQHFADECGLGKLDKEDVQDPLVNLNLGACLFSSLLKKFNGNVALALAGYNSGPDSETTKKLSHLIDGHPETMGYVAKYLVLQQEMQ